MNIVFKVFSFKSQQSVKTKLIAVEGEFVSVVWRAKTKQNTRA